MNAPTYRALDRIANGLGMVEPGEIVPATYIGTLGEENPVDFDRLLTLGVVEPAAKTHPAGASSKPAAAAGATAVKRKRAAKSKPAAAAGA